MNDVKILVDDLAKMVAEGKILEAFEKYYAEDVIMQENNDVPRVGKDANRAHEEAFVNGVTDLRSMQVLGVASGDNYSTIEYFMDLTHKDWGDLKTHQVAVQRWKDGKIINEKFYYNKG